MGSDGVEEDKPRVVLCPYCGEVAELVDSAEVYGGRSYGPIYLCRACMAYVGVHPGTLRPLGMLANAELRELRKQAHAAFDTLWKSADGQRHGAMRRSDAYNWLSAKLGVKVEDCHIGHFDVARCKQVIKVCMQERMGAY